jgi:hypothetical protein
MYFIRTFERWLYCIWIASYHNYNYYSKLCKRKNNLELSEKIINLKEVAKLVQKEWVDFTIFDLSFDEEYHYTKEKFEHDFNDKFVAVELDVQGRPKYIWTEKYVFQILKYHRMMGQPFMVGIPRNPVYKH